MQTSSVKNNNKRYNVNTIGNSNNTTPSIQTLSVKNNNNRYNVNKLRNSNNAKHLTNMFTNWKRLNNTNTRKSMLNDYVQYINGDNKTVIFFETTLSANNRNLFSRLGNEGNATAKEFLKMLSGGFIFIKNGPFGDGMYAKLFLKALVDFAKALTGKNVPIIPGPQPDPPPGPPPGPFPPPKPRILKNPRDAIQSLTSALTMIKNAKTFILSLQNNNNVINNQNNGTKNQRSQIKDVLDAIRMEVNSNNMNNRLLVSRPITNSNNNWSSSFNQ